MSREDPRAGEWIALYGSLMRGLGAMDALGISELLRYAGPCVVAGELFDLGDYPGLRHGSGHVIAELYALLDPNVLQTLDEFEGFRSSEPRGSLYLRERTELIEPAATTAWLYVYNAVPDASARIIDGDWRAHLEVLRSR